VLVHALTRKLGWYGCLLFCSVLVPAYAQNAVVAGFQPLTEWKGAWRQKPLRQYLPLAGRWLVTNDKLAANTSVVLPALFPIGGEFSCTREIFLDAGLAERPLRFVVGPVSYRCHALINGHLAGNHEAGGAAFAFDLNSQHLLPGQNNKLRMVIDTQLQPLTTLPARLRPQAGRYTPGVHENVFIEVLPDVAIDSVRCLTRLEPENAATLDIKVALSLRDKLPAPPIAPAGASRFGKKIETESMFALVAELYDSTGSQRLAAVPPVTIERVDDLQQEFALSLRVDNPRLWSPATPHLYRLRLAVSHGALPIDEWWETIGLRQIQWQKNRLLINGQPLMLRGVEWMASGFGSFSVADSAACEEIIRRAQEWGGNLLRVVGHPAPPPLLAAADRSGILVLEEIPIYYLTPAHLSKNRFLDIAKSALGELITRDRNHPSLLGWGLAANTPLLPLHEPLFQRLRQAANSLDDRALYAVAELRAARSWQALADALIIDSFEKDVTSEWPSFRDFDKPVLSRFGFSLAAVGSGLSNDQPNEVTAQQRQANKFKNALDKFAANQGLMAGYVIAALQDWRVDAPLLRAGYRPNPEVYPAGLLSLAGEPRLSFQVFQAAHRNVRGPVLPPENFKVKHPDVYTSVGIGLVVFVLLFINRDKRLLDNLRRVFAHPHGFYVDVVENRKISPILTVTIAGAEGCIAAILLSGFLFAYRNSGVLDNVLMLLSGDATIKAKLTWLIWHPGWFILAGAGAFVILGIGLAGLMRIVAFVFGRRVTLSQLLTLVFWSAANVLWLGIVTPFFYALLASGKFVQPLFFGVIIVMLWFLVRVFRGMRVLFGVNAFKTLILFVIVFGGVGLSIYLYYDRSQALWDYTRHYWSQLMNK
jgi:hypothetical protein